MRDRLNLRLAAALLVGAVLASAAAAAAHRWQVRRLAPGLLGLAATAEARGNTDRATKLLTEYLGFAPADADARARYARLLESQAVDAKGRRAAADQYELALQTDPGRADLRLPLARLHAGLGQFPEAIAQLEAANAAAGPDADAVELLGDCQHGAGQPEKAIALYQRAVAIDPKRVNRWYKLATLMCDTRITNDPAKVASDLKVRAEADAVADRMVAANPGSAARLARVVYRTDRRGPAKSRTTGRVGPGLEFTEDDRRANAADLAEAERLDPTDADVRLAAARAAGDRETARRHLRTALEHHPEDARVRLALAEVEAADGNLDAAAAQLREAARRRPRDPQPLFALAELAVYAVERAKPADRAAAVAAAERALGELDRWKHPPERVGLLRGRLRVAGGEWAAAKASLEAARPALTTAGPKLAAEADVLLGRCHAALGEDDLAVTAFRRAAAGDPSRTDASVGVAEALLRGGRLGEAADEYFRLTHPSAADDGTWLMYARVRTLQYLSTAAGSRQAARDIEPVFKEVEEEVPGSPELVVLQAEVLAADQPYQEGKPHPAEALLRAAVRQKPAAPELAIPLAQLLARWGKTDAAWAALDDLERAADRSAGVRIALARLQVVPADGERAGAAARAAEARFAEEKSPAERARLAEGLAEACARWKKADDARRWAREVADLRPTDLTARFRLFDLAATPDAMAEAVARIREAEQKVWNLDQTGPVGHYAEAALRLRLPRPTADDLKEAREHLRAAAAKRPAWACLPTARAVIAMIERRPDEALAEYLRAFELGERRPAAIGQAVRLLLDRRRYAEADRLVQRAGADAALTTGGLGRLAAEAWLNNGQIDRAVQLAGTAAPGAEVGYKDQLWRAEVFAAANQPAEALAAFRRATEQADGSAEPWVALVRYHLREKRFQEAEAVVAGLPGRLRGAALLLATGRCRELMGQAKPAEDAYRAAVEAGPTNFEAVREWAEYQSRAGRPVEAVPALRRLLAADPKPDVVPAARRLLALALATSPKPDDFREAVAAADRNLADGGNAPEDLLVKARVLATRLYLRRDAVRLAREADARQPLTDPADQFFLAQLLADTGAWPEGRRRLVDLLSRTGPDPARLRFLADRLLRNKQADEAGVWLDRLEAVAAADPGTARLRAAWHAARGNPEAAAARLVEAAGDGTTAADRDRCRALAAAAADLAREFDPTRATLGAAAEALYRRAAAGGDPADVSALAVCLAANGKLGEALDRCRAVPPLDAAVALVGIAYAPAALTDDDLAAVERAVAGVLPQVPQAVRDQIDGAVHARRGRYREAAEAFGRAAAGGDPAMLNNAAYMRVLAGGPAEAEPLAERAIAAVGPTASLLDTRGTARLATGRAAEAVADLEAAVDQEPTAARWLHLAAAYKAAGRTEDARKAVGKADKSRHDGSLLVPAEGRAYQRLAEELRPGKGSRL